MPTKTRARSKARKGTPRYYVSAYYPAQQVYTRLGRKKDRTVEKLARQCRGRFVGSGAELVGRSPRRDLQFSFNSRDDAKCFIGELKVKRIRRSGITR